MNPAVKVSTDCQPPDKCSQAIEGEGGEPPMERRIWGVELGHRHQNLEAAHNAARYVFTSPLMLRIITMLFFLLSKISVTSAQRSSPSKFFRCCQSVQRLDTGYEPLGKCVKDMKRLKEEVNVAFKAGRLNEADRSPGPKYGM